MVGTEVVSAIREIIQVGALAIFIILLLQSTIRNYEVSGPSMEPLLGTGNRVIVNRVVYMGVDKQRLSKYIPWQSNDVNGRWYLFHPPQEGDIVVFEWPRNPDQKLVKRVIGTPGNTVGITRGTVFVNQEPISEPYVQKENGQTIGRRSVPQDHYYLLGDNRAESDDSRHWGFVPEENIVGRV